MDDPNNTAGNGNDNVDVDTNNANGEDPPADPSITSPYGSLDPKRRADLVCFYFSQGKTIPSILEILKTQHGLTDLPRDVPYHDLARATQRGWLTYNPSEDLSLARKLKDRFGLLEVDVPSAGDRLASINAAAEMITRNVRFIALDKIKKDEPGRARTWEFPMGRLDKMNEEEYFDDGFEGNSVTFGIRTAENSNGDSDPANFGPLPMPVFIRMGLSGGRAMSLMSNELGRRLSRSIPEVEKELKEEVLRMADEGPHAAKIANPTMRRRFRVVLRFVFVNLVSGFDHELRPNPISFITSMIANEGLASSSRVRCFNASPFVKIDERTEILEKVDEVKKLVDFLRRKPLDFIVTSAGCMRDPHSTLSRYFSKSPARELLAGAGVQGDFLWLPVLAKDHTEFLNNGDFDFEKFRSTLTDDARQAFLYRPMTLLNLDDIARHIGQDSHKHDVVLILSPCGTCYEDKSQVLTAILDRRQRIVSHLIVDRHTAQATLKQVGA